MLFIFGVLLSIFLFSTTQSKPAMKKQQVSYWWVSNNSIKN